MIVEQEDGTLTCTPRAHLVHTGTSEPLTMTLRFDPNIPVQVALLLSVPACRDIVTGQVDESSQVVEWLVLRDHLATGTPLELAIGDVRIRRYEQSPFLMLDLTPHSDIVTLRLATLQVDAFLAATYSSVPADVEGDVLAGVVDALPR